MKKQKLTQAWRWYGPNDPVSLIDIRQAGATVIVTALHHIPHGEVWPIEEILLRKQEIEEAGLKWEVVESVPVHEAIKTARDDAQQYIENYKTTLRNLSACGIYTVCYNFMPVLDWTRTDIAYTLPNGAKALRFDWVDLAMFDLFMLRRDGAENDYTPNVITGAQLRYQNYSQEEKVLIMENILMGIPNEKAVQLDELIHSISLYNSIGKDGLRANLKRFLTEVADTCISNKIKLTLHPDDPPYAILGLPRIVSTKEDYEALLTLHTGGFHGFCFCTGSLGAHPQNNILELFDLLKARTYFIHLRNVKKDEHGNFYESDHLDGDVPMVALMQQLIEENQHRDTPIPLRPDHGHQILDDLHKVSNPGYSAIGRLKGLAELRGLETGLIGFQNLIL